MGFATLTEWDASSLLATTQNSCQFGLLIIFSTLLFFWVEISSEREKCLGHERNDPSQDLNSELSI